MSNILNFEEHAKSHKFNEDVINILSEANSLYEYGQDGNNGIAYLHFNKYIYIFFKYIPRGETTDLPNLLDSLQGLESNYRFSKGEWTVEKITILEKKDALRFFPVIYSKNKPKGWIESFKSRIITEVLNKDKDK